MFCAKLSVSHLQKLHAGNQLRHVASRESASGRLRRSIKELSNPSLTTHHEKKLKVTRLTLTLRICGKISSNPVHLNKNPSMRTFAYNLPA